MTKNICCGQISINHHFLNNTSINKFSAAESTIPSKESEKYYEGTSNISTSGEIWDCQRKEDSTNVQSNSAAMSLLLEMLNDQSIRDLVIERHREAFEKYIVEISHL